MYLIGHTTFRASPSEKKINKKVNERVSLCVVAASVHGWSVCVCVRACADFIFGIDTLRLFPFQSARALVGVVPFPSFFFVTLNLFVVIAFLFVPPQRSRTFFFFGSLYETRYMGRARRGKIVSFKRISKTYNVFAHSLETREERKLFFVVLSTSGDYPGVEKAKLCRDFTVISTKPLAPPQPSTTGILLVLLNISVTVDVVGQAVYVEISFFCFSSVAAVTAQNQNDRFCTVTWSSTRIHIRQEYAQKST